MSILDKIIETKRKELTVRKRDLPQDQFLDFPLWNRPTLSLSGALLEKQSSGVIAEFKRRSPSKGAINEIAKAGEVARAYAAAGAAAISVLTDSAFFGGSLDDLADARQQVKVPLLRKEFIIDPYQIYEAKAFGADAILLIAACLQKEDVRSLASLALSLGLEPVLELHDESELGHICDETVLIGVNNRNLGTFEVDTGRSLRMASQIPSGKILIAESGIESAETVTRFRESGFSGFLIGERFMRHADPGQAFRHWMEGLNCAR